MERSAMKELVGGMLNGMKDVLAAKAGEGSLERDLNAFRHNRFFGLRLA